MSKINKNVLKVLAKYMNDDYYNILPLAKGDYTYRMSFGERSNGKTFAVKLLCLIDYVLNGNKMGLIRRWSEDFVGKRGQTMFDDIILNTKYGNILKEITNGQWTDIYYYSGRWYLAKWDEDLNKRIKEDQPFCYGFSLSAGEHDKGTSYTKINNIFFDEFIARINYLNDEFILFMNTISTIVRDRGGVSIFMAANTLSQFCPYFVEMGIKDHVRKMKEGTIEICSYGNSGITLAIEYCESKGRSKESAKYFAFDNPKLKMIVGGDWELDIYPHLPIKYKQNNIEFSYFIIFSDIYLQCDIVSVENNYFTYIHKKTTPIRNENSDIVYSQEYRATPNYKRKISKPKDDLEKYIWWYFAIEKVFYQDNDVGEVVRGYLEWCRNEQAM